MENRALSQKPRHEPADVIPLTQELALLDWLQSTGRLIPREDAIVESAPRDEGEIDLILDDSDDSFNNGNSEDE